MLAFFKKTAVVILISALIGIGAVLLFLTMWWFNWPFLTLAIAVCTLGSLILCFFAGRQFLIWNNRRRYVRKVLNEQQTLHSEPEQHDNAVDEAWMRGMRIIERSGSSACALPWFLVFGRKGSGKTWLAQSFSADSPELDHEAPFCWHFLPDSVLIEVSGVFFEDASSCRPAWERFLTLLSEARRKEPVNGLIFTCRSPDLAECANPASGVNAEQQIRNDARRMLSLAQDIQSVFGTRMPLYFCATFGDVLPGIRDLLTSLTVEERSQVIGTDDLCDLGGEKALRRASEQLDRLILQSVLRCEPRGDILDAPLAPLTLLKGILAAEEILRRSSPHAPAPLPGGFYITAQAEDNAPVCFAKLFFTSLLPDARMQLVPSEPPSVRSHLYGMSNLLWYLATFAFCCMTAANTLYNVQALSNLPPMPHQSDPIPAAQVLSSRLNTLENAEKHWWFPGLGLNRVQEIGEQEQTNFLDFMIANLIQPLIVSLKNTDAQTGESLERLLWMQEALSAAENTGSCDSVRKQPFPIGTTACRFWSLDFGELFLSFAEHADPQQRKHISASLSEAAFALLRNDKADFFDRLTEHINERFGQYAIHLSDFWIGVPDGTADAKTIPACYTVKGYSALQTTLRRLMPSEEHDLAFKEMPFWKNYIRSYAEAWADFAAGSDEAWQGNSRADSLFVQASGKRFDDDPSIRILKKMARELTPLRSEAGAAVWIQDLYKIDAALQVASSSDNETDSSFWHVPVTLFRAAKEVPDALRTLKETLPDPGQFMRSVAALHAYASEIQNLRILLNSGENCLELSRTLYGGKQYGDPDKTAAVAADRQLQETLRLLNIRTENSRNAINMPDFGSRSPAASLLRGPLRFLTHAIVISASLELQRIWESDVITPSLLFSPDHQYEGIFGERGTVSIFIKEQATPFMDRRPDAFSAKRRIGETFPFTADFLTFARLGQSVQTVPLKESYALVLASQTCDVNPDAAERIEYVQCTVSDGSGNQVTLRNSNYPNRTAFTFRTGQVGSAKMEITFPSVTLKLQYADCLAFLREFSGGERIFTQDDFPESARIMESLGIRRITVRILPENSSELLALTDLEPPQLPERIVRAW
ncbi:MAG: type VI secretion protein IcmF/TssM N-terminal domain-containing protein [Desulfovibrionaceae bacterium]|nr:type VI secretion protein IcmF/TssM N-terminal domain-containing protein [Desulfovibrionaceae bacterium]